jgi:FkbM family methyltransferase
MKFEIIKYSNFKKEKEIKNPISNWPGVIDISRNNDENVKPLENQWKDRKLHESDFEAFSFFEGSDGLFLDVGANCGQSAISFRSVNSSMFIKSIEPNILLEPILNEVKKWLPNYEYSMIGLSDESSTMSFYIPAINNYFVTPLASLDSNSFDTKEAADRLLKFANGEKVILVEMQIKLEKLDNLNLSPTVIKIDAEENELKCLQGMLQILETNRPLLMIENNSKRDEIYKLLSELRYNQFVFNSLSGTIEKYPSQSISVNIFYVPDHSNIFDADCFIKNKFK